MTTPSPAGATPPKALLLDVNETLSDLTPMRERLDEVGLGADQLTAWFASTLRDGFALSTVGDQASFADLAGAVLRTMLTAAGVAGPYDDAVQHVLTGFTQLDLHPDVVPGLRAVADQGIRIATLSNGSADIAEGLLERAEVRDAVELVLSVSDAGIWKPAGGSYAWGLERLGLAAAEAMMVAVHPWDLHGADRAGMRTAWIDRGGAPWPSVFAAPHLRADDVEDLARRLSGPSPR